MPRGSGRRPTPTALKKLRGNPGKREFNDKEPTPEAGEPAMPKGLSKFAIEKWKSLVPELLAIGVLTKIDGEALANLCTAYSHQQIAEKAIQRMGTTAIATDKQGKLLKHWNDATKIMKQFEVEFGLTPASRSHISIDKPKEADPFDDYMNKGARASAKHVN
jgi:P27 family predicted phage terminase small subunit